MQPSFTHCQSLSFLLSISHLSFALPLCAYRYTIIIHSHFLSFSQRSFSPLPFPPLPFRPFPTLQSHSLPFLHLYSLPFPFFPFLSLSPLPFPFWVGDVLQVFFPWRDEALRPSLASLSHVIGRSWSLELTERLHIINSSGISCTLYCIFSSSQQQGRSHSFSLS